MTRPKELSDFLRTLRTVLTPVPDGPESVHAQSAVARIFDALDNPGVLPDPDPRPPEGVLANHLTLALDNADAAPLAELTHAFAALAPRLRWEPRVGSDRQPEFHENHLNTAIVGPVGELERREDVIVGAGLMNPQTTYPTHSHPPEELYVVMCNGEWFREDRGWYSPGFGGVVYHRPNVRHAMRALDAPLLAVWCLYVETG